VPNRKKNIEVDSYSQNGMQYASLIDENKMQSQQMLCYIPFSEERSYLKSELYLPKKYSTTVHPLRKGTRKKYNFASKMFKKHNVRTLTWRILLIFFFFRLLENA
jgi:hypothetical protein